MTHTRCYVALCRQVRWERTVAPRRAGTKGKGSIRPLCSGGGAIAHNERFWYWRSCGLDELFEPHGFAAFGISVECVGCLTV
jgi:hypothetical protein